MSDLIRTELTAGAEAELENVVSQVNDATSEQRKVLDALSEDASQIIAQAQSAAEAAHAVQNSAASAHQQAEQGSAGVADANSKLQQLRSSFEDIAKLLGEIGDLSNQIDLLALNANIEAEKAGVAGRRFSVVAAEVKDLARRTQRSKESIDDVVVQLFGDLDTLTVSLDQSTTRIDDALEASEISRVAGEDIASALIELCTITDRAGMNITEVKSTSDFVDRSMHDMGVIGTTFEAMLAHMRADGLFAQHNDPLERLAPLVAESTFHDPTRFLNLGEELVMNERDIIISITDPRGVITYANHSFVTFAEYQAQDLVGKPHNVIRHPDMPRAAFEDLWQVIKNGELWQGYVVNRSKLGKHYWVKATVFPYLKSGRLQGYISLRTKPEAGAIARAIEAYRQLP